jgi:hypothetical protein
MCGGIDQHEIGFVGGRNCADVELDVEVIIAAGFWLLLIRRPKVSAPGAALSGSACFKIAGVTFCPPEDLNKASSALPYAFRVISPACTWQFVQALWRRTLAWLG